MNEAEKDTSRPPNNDDTIGCMVCGEPIPVEKDRRTDNDNVICSDCRDALYEYKGCECIGIGLVEYYISAME